jgi:hypothetical protein
MDTWIFLPPTSIGTMLHGWFLFCAPNRRRKNRELGASARSEGASHFIESAYIRGAASLASGRPEMVMSFAISGNSELGFSGAVV